MAVQYKNGERTSEPCLYGMICKPPPAIAWTSVKNIINISLQQLFAKYIASPRSLRRYVHVAEEYLPGSGSSTSKAYIPLAALKISIISDLEKFPALTSDAQGQPFVSASRPKIHQLRYYTIYLRGVKHRLSIMSNGMSR